jgi:hypothetical protein
VSVVYCACWFAVWPVSPDWSLELGINADGADHAVHGADHTVACVVLRWYMLHSLDPGPGTAATRDARHLVNPKPYGDE